MSMRIPRDNENDYTEEMASQRRDFASERTAASLNHVAYYSIDPAITAGNIENFLGVAQVPLGLVWPVLCEGRPAKGDFYVPMATTEGSLIAS